MSLPPDVLRRLARVAHARTRSFTAMVEMAGLDKARAFRGADLRRVDFGEDDLGGYDFSFADLRGADLSRVRGIGALVLEGARLDGAKLSPPTDFNLDEVHRMILAGDAPPAPWRPFIEELRFGGEENLRDLSPLAGLSALRTLDLDSTAVVDLSPLAGLSALRTLDLNRTAVVDLSPLAGLSALQWLHLDSTAVVDLSPLAGLSALQTLDLDSTAVVDLSPLAGLSALQRLHLNRTAVVDLSPLAGLRHLTVFKDGETIRPAELHHRKTGTTRAG